MLHQDLIISVSDVLLANHNVNINIRSLSSKQLYLMCYRLTTMLSKYYVRDGTE